MSMYKGHYANGNLGVVPVAEKHIEDFAGYTVAPAALAQLTSLTDRRIRQLAKEEVIPQRKRGVFDPVEAVNAYISYVKSGGNTKGAPTHFSDTSGEYNGYRLRQMKASAEESEIKVAAMRGELHRAEDVRAVMGGMIGASRAKLLSIPSKLAPRLIGQQDIAVVQDMLKKEIYDALQEISEYSAEVFNRRNEAVVSGKVGAADEPDADS